MTKPGRPGVTFSAYDSPRQKGNVGNTKRMSKLPGLLSFLAKPVPQKEQFSISGIPTHEYVMESRRYQREQKEKSEARQRELLASRRPTVSSAGSRLSFSKRLSKRSAPRAAASSIYSVTSRPSLAPRSERDSDVESLGSDSLGESAAPSPPASPAMARSSLGSWVRRSFSLGARSSPVEKEADEEQVEAPQPAVEAASAASERLSIRSTLSKGSRRSAASRASSQREVAPADADLDEKEADAAVEDRHSIRSTKSKSSRRSAAAAEIEPELEADDEEEGAEEEHQSVRSTKSKSSRRSAASRVSSRRLSVVKEEENPDDVVAPEQADEADDVAEELEEEMREVDEALEVEGKRRSSSSILRRLSSSLSARSNTEAEADHDDEAGACEPAEPDAKRLSASSKRSAASAKVEEDADEEAVQAVADWRESLRKSLVSRLSGASRKSLPAVEEEEVEADEVATAAAAEEEEEKRLSAGSGRSSRSRKSTRSEAKQTAEEEAEAQAEAAVEAKRQSTSSRRKSSQSARSASLVEDVNQEEEEEEKEEEKAVDADEAAEKRASTASRLSLLKRLSGSSRKSAPDEADVSKSRLSTPSRASAELSPAEIAQEETKTAEEEDEEAAQIVAEWRKSLRLSQRSAQSEDGQDEEKRPASKRFSLRSVLPKRSSCVRGPPASKPDDEDEKRSLYRLSHCSAESSRSLLNIFGSENFRRSLSSQGLDLDETPIDSLTEEQIDLVCDTFETVKKEEAVAKRSSKGSRRST